MKRTLRSSAVVLTVLAMTNLYGCPQPNTDPSVTPSPSATTLPVVNPSAKITFVPAVKVGDIAGKPPVTVKSGTNEITLEVKTASTATVIQKFNFASKPSKMDILDKEDKVVGSTTDIKEISAGRYEASFNITGEAQVTDLLAKINTVGFKFSPTADGFATKQNSNSLNVSAAQVKVSFVAAGVVQEVTISVPAGEDGVVSTEAMAAALAAQGVDISAVTKVDVPTPPGMDPTIAQAALASITAAVTQLSVAAGIEPPAVQAVATDPNAVSGPIGTAG